MKNIKPLSFLSKYCKDESLQSMLETICEIDLQSMLETICEEKGIKVNRVNGNCKYEVIEWAKANKNDDKIRLAKVIFYFVEEKYKNNKNNKNEFYYLVNLNRIEETFKNSYGDKELKLKTALNYYTSLSSFLCSIFYGSWGGDNK